MAETITVTTSPGTPYTWAQAKFTWTSATAGKSWATATPAVYALAVASTLGLGEVLGKQMLKVGKEAVGLSEASRRQVTLARADPLAFSETYVDLIAYVLRFMESLAMSERLGRSATKALAEALQLVEGATKGLILRRFEALALAETYTDLIAYVVRVSESLAVQEKASKAITHPQSESLGMGDSLSQTWTKRVAESLGVAEAWGRAVAFRRSLVEGLAFDDAKRLAQTLRIGEALVLAEQYRRRANGVVSDMIVGSAAITEQDFLEVLESGHPPGYSSFRDFIQGDYTYQRALFRAILSSRNADRGYIDGLRVTVDVPDVFDRGTAEITQAASGVTVTFTRTFRVEPEVTLTYKGGIGLAIPRVVGTPSTTGFTAVLENTAGQRVVGLISWVAQGH